MVDISDSAYCAGHDGGLFHDEGRIRAKRASVSVLKMASLFIRWPFHFHLHPDHSLAKIYG